MAFFYLVKKTEETESCVKEISDFFGANIFFIGLTASGVQGALKIMSSRHCNAALIVTDECDACLEAIRSGLPSFEALSFDNDVSVAGLMERLDAERITGKAVENPTSSDDYATLKAVLDDALKQASEGKGKERHGNGLPFTKQPMFTIADNRGIGFMLGQADKKSIEAQGMLERGDIGAFERELLGAINYLAGAIIFAKNGGKK